MIYSICITGVDGVGKSTIVNRIKCSYPERLVFSQYMGAKDWQSKFAQWYFENDIFPKFNFIVMNIDLRYRVRKVKKMDKIIIFDRYAEEQYVYKLNKNALVRFIYRVLYKDFFFKPDLQVYLTCPTYVSISRKDDLNTEKEKNMLIKNKIRLDNYYLNKKNTLVFDTSLYSLEDVVNTISSYIKTS